MVRRNAYTFGYLQTQSERYRLLAPMPCDEYYNGMEMFYVCPVDGGTARMVAVSSGYDIDLLQVGQNVEILLPDEIEEVERYKISLNDLDNLIQMSS